MMNTHYRHSYPRRWANRRPCYVLGADPSRPSVAKASLWSIFTSLPQPLMAVPAYVFVRMFEPLLPIGLGFAAGAMIWMVFAELIPDALKSATSGSIGITVALAMTALWSLQYFLLSH